MKKLVLFYVLFFIVFSLVYLLLFRTPLFAEQKVLFYRGLSLLGVSLVLMSGSLFIFRRKLKSIKMESMISALVLSASLHLVFFVIFPVTFDRSVSMFLLNSINTPTQTSICKGVSDKDLRNDLINIYVRKQNAVGRRIKEQSIIGFVEGDNSCRLLTPKAQQFLMFSGIVSQIYGLSAK